MSCPNWPFPIECFGESQGEKKRIIEKDREIEEDTEIENSDGERKKE